MNKTETQKYFHRIFAIFLSVVMVLCMMPQMAYAEEALLADNIILTGSGIESDPYLITSPEDLKSLEGQTVSGYYQLAKDVDMSGVSMSPIRSFSGTLDGNGNAIRNLNLSGGSKTALIGEFKGGTIKNLTLDQAIVNATSDYSGALIGYLSDSTMIESCTVINSSITSSAGYVGGMIGQIYGSSTKVDVKYCAVKDTTVESTKTSSTYIGGLIGDISSAEVTVEGSYSSAQVKGAQYVGGLVGRTSGALFSFNNTYVTGTVISPYTSSYVYSGGFIGGASVSSSKPGSFENCYFGGAIQNSTDATGYTGVLYGCSSASSYQYPSLSNCYYDMDKNFEETKYEITGKTTSDMKDPAFAAMLGGAYEAAAGDYPILKWQNPNAIYSATFHVEPIDAIVTLDGTQQSPTADGVYTMTGLVSGQSISYTVTQEEGAETDYKPVSGTLVIGKSDAVKTIKLLPNIYDLKFHLVPEDAEFQVTDAENSPLTPTETTSGDYTYHVANGTYYYQCRAFGYEEMSGEAVVDHGESINNVTLNEKSKDTVTFQLMAEGKEADLKDFSIQVSCGDHFAETKNGTVQLYEGYTYDYIIRSKNYATVSGKLDWKDGTVKIELTEKTAWEGAEDLSEPEQIGEVYQISTGGELAWFAGLINGTLDDVSKNTEASAILVKDIDMGSEEWTPIGRNSFFMGTFDGNGHTITNLYVASGSYSGLFGTVGANGSVLDLTVTGEFNGTSNVGGIAGQNQGTISNVVNRAEIHATSSPAGGIIGDNSGTVTNVVNEGIISSTSYNLGGIAGKNTGQIVRAVNHGAVATSYSSYSSSSGGIGGIVGYDSNTRAGEFSVSDSVNTGDVTGENTQNIGGIIGYGSGGYSSKISVANVYNTGDIIAKGNVGGIIGYFYSVDLNYAYNRGLVTKGSGSNAGEIAGYVYGSSNHVSDVYYDNAEGKIPFGSGSLSAVAGISNIAGKGNFISDAQNINEGYPILNWQDTTPRYTLQLTVEPADAEINLLNESGTEMMPITSENGKYVYSLVEGTYDYTVKKFGMKEKSGKVNVTAQSAPIEETVTLEAADFYPVTFHISPEDVTPSITVSYGQTQIEPEDFGVYSLPAGTYDYTVKAKGYGKVTGTIEVKEKGETVSVVLMPTSAWDGETLEKPQNINGIWQISSGEELAWFAALVNNTLEDGTPADEKANAVLCDDIDLGSNLWTPVGSASHKFQGTFDGNGFTVFNLKIESDDNDYVGFFGYINSAEIKNLMIKGQITASGRRVGGLVGRAEDNFKIINCGNFVDVTNQSTSSDYTAGILAESYYVNYSAKGTIEGCFNQGTIENSNGYASGIVASMSSGTIKNCYNSGLITGKTAVGIAGASSNTYTNCFNTGTVSGTGTAYSICSSNYADYDSCYYLNGVAANDDAQHGIGMTEDAMKAEAFIAKLGTDTWKADTSGLTNSGYPILHWQQVTEPTEKGQKLDVPKGLKWIVTGILPEDAVTVSALQGLTANIMPLEDDDFDQGGSMDPDKYDVNYTTEVKWDVVTGAESYTVKLYNYSDYCESKYVEEEDPIPVYTKEGVSGTSFDFKEAFEKLEDEDIGLYMFTVTAIGDGVYYLDSDESPLDGDGYIYYGTMQISAPEGLRWVEVSKRAVWEPVVGADGYFVNLYKDGTLIDEAVVEVNDDALSEISVSFTEQIVNSGTYFFTVRAAYVVKEDGPNFGNTFTSDMVVSPDFKYTSTEVEWIDITSASQWIEIANTSAQGTDYESDYDAQYVAWSKNYRLTEDIDFSNLTAEEQAKTKSWGNTNVHFSGILDGNGHKITGLTLSSGDGGLIAYNGAQGTVKNLIVDSANVLFSDNAAVICWMNYGTITGSAVLNTNITADTGAIIGGMVSRNYGLIEKSYVQGGKLTANSTTANGHGGFVGGNYGQIRECYTTMDVVTKSYNAGGFAGWADSSGDHVASFEDCFALGNVSAANGWSGGFVGRVNSASCTFTNCYAANTVISEKKPDKSFGFTGALGSEGYNDISGSEGGFSITLSEKNFINCYYAQDLTASDNGGSYAKKQTLAQMKTDQFKTDLGKNWTRKDSENQGLPYLLSVTPPKQTDIEEITVQLLVATYDTESYGFQKATDVIDVTVESSGNTRVIDVMDAAQDQGKITYTYTVSPAYGSFIETINGKTLSSPDGWMFTVNDTLSNVSATLASIKDGDKILWYEGKTQNLYKGPTWSQMTGTVEEDDVITITTKQELIALCSASEDALSKHYKLGANIDLQGEDFPGIGSNSQPFTGIFDGNEYVISNLRMEAKEASIGTGFFNYIKGATIKNVTLENVNVTGGNPVGALVGYAMVEVNNTSMDGSIGNLIGNCYVSGEVKSLFSENTAGAYAGGLIGFNDGDIDPKTGISIYSSIDNCISDVDVVAITAYAGGLAGGNFGYITNSSASGSVEGGNGIGGFIGGNNGGIYDCHASGSVAGNNVIGGFAGASTESIERCYSIGDVKANSDTSTEVGGFLGSGSGIVKDSMSAGTVHGGFSYIGGFAGEYTGTLSGLEKDIQLSGCYGNCLDGAGKTLPAIGNKTSSTVEAEKEVLKKMSLTEREDVADKLFELFHVTLDGFTEQQLQSILKAIYETLSKEAVNNDQGSWVTADMTAFEDAYNTERSLTDEEIQNYINYVAENAYSTDSAGDISKYIISLKALGYDARKVVTVNQESGTYFDLVDKLKNMVKGQSGGSNSIYTLPYILIALQQDKTYATEDEIEEIIEMILSQQLDDGGWGSVMGLDIDAVSPVASALAPYYETHPEVKEALDKALSVEKIAQLQGDSGAIYSSWTQKPSVESTGLLLSALGALGKDYEEYKKGDNTLLDGLMQMLNDTQDGFLANGNPVMATEQGFRGLLTALQSQDTSYRIYDFSHKPSNIAKANGSGTETGPQEPTAPDEITVYVSVKTDTEMWLDHEAVTVKSDAKVYHAFVDALAKAGMSQSGAASGYVKSITKDGVTLSEFDKGKNSGWLYTVNGTLPLFPLTSYGLQDGDEILWYYTVDYTTDPNAGGLVKPEDTPKITITDEDGNVITVGGKVEYDSTTGILTITPDQGYEIKDVIINGVSKGPVATVEGLTKDDDVKVVFGKIQEEADPTQSIIDGVKATTIKLKTTKAGKGYIKMEWTKSKGYKVDYYQVFRSTKRYEGYGKKPFFVKETSNLKSTYKNNKMLKKGTRYYYKVRGVRVIDGKKYYTQWSNKGWRIAK